MTLESTSRKPQYRLLVADSRQESVRRALRRGSAHLGYKTIVSIADAIHDAALRPTRFPDPRILIKAIGGQVCCGQVDWCQVDGNVIEYEWNADQRERGLAVHWGLAAFAIRLFQHDAYDVWRLCARVVVPHEITPTDPVALVAAQQYAPEWFVKYAIPFR